MQLRFKFGLFLISVLCTCSFANAQNFDAQFDSIKIKPSSSSSSLGPHQKASNVNRPKPPKPLTKEFSMGFRLNTDGWSAYGDLGKSLPIDSKRADRFYKIHLWQFEFTEKKDPHEIKSTSAMPGANGSNPSTFIFGKVNNFYVLKIGYGSRTMIAGKPDDPGIISIHWVNAGGLAAGFLKPYYLNVSGDPVAIKYTTATQMDFLNSNSIIGSAGFTKGLDEVKFIPGVHFKTAMHFDFSSNLRNVIAIEAGANAEYYFQPINLIATIPSVNYFVDVFVAFQFGRRW